MPQKGGARKTHDAVSVGSSVKVCCAGYNAVLVHHAMTGQTSGGFVGLTMSDKEDGTFIAHHGEGTNIKSAASATNYISILKGIMDWVSVNLAVTDGTNTVIIQPINI